MDKDYENDKKYFTFADLKAEVPFDTEMIRLPMPGYIISESVKTSRLKSYLSPPIPNGGYFQIDDGMIYNEKLQKVTHINNELINDNEIYQISLPFITLTGLDDNEILVQWGKQNSDLFKPEYAEEMGQPLKYILVSYFSKAIYYEIGDFDTFDRLHKGYLTKSDIKTMMAKYFNIPIKKLSIHPIWKVLDTDNSGFISRQEFLRISIYNIKARNLLGLTTSNTNQGIVVFTKCFFYFTHLTLL